MKISVYFIKSDRFLHGSSCRYSY